MTHRCATVDSVDLNASRSAVTGWEGNVDFGPVEVVFDNIEQRLVALLDTYDAYVGCVAWFTSRGVLSNLTKPHVFVIQREEGLLRNAYLNTVYSAPTGLDLSVVSPAVGAGVTCTTAFRWAGYDAGASVSSNDDGDWRRSPRRNVPRMHHKFVVFLERRDRFFYPKAVWTGSYNITENGKRSLDNAIVVRSELVATRYYFEFVQCLRLSKPVSIAESPEPVTERAAALYAKLVREKLEGAWVDVFGEGTGTGDLARAYVAKRSFRCFASHVRHDAGTEVWVVLYEAGLRYVCGCGCAPVNI